MSRRLVKVCGLSTPGTVDAAVAAGADYIGLVFFPASPRNVAVDLAASLAKQARGRSRIVGLFVDPTPGQIEAVCNVVPLDVVQLHGQEQPALAAHIGQATGLEVWKAIGVRTSGDLSQARGFANAAARILYDAKPPEGAPLPGGTGLRIDWDLLKGVRHPLPWGLAGGLTPTNVAEAASTTDAPLIDASSGLESAPGVKDPEKIRAFIAAARSS